MQRDMIIVLGHTDRVSNEEAIDVCNMIRRGKVTAEGCADGYVDRRAML